MRRPRRDGKCPGTLSSFHSTPDALAGLSTTLPDASEHVYDEYKKGKRDAQKKGSVAAKVLDESRSCVMVVTADSLLGGLDYSAKLGKYHEWFKAAKGP